MSWDAVYAALGELEKQDVERLREGAARACALLDKIQERLGVAETNGVAILKAIDQRDARIAELEAQVVAFARQKILDGRRIAELEEEILNLVHPFDLAAYRAKKKK